MAELKKYLDTTALGTLVDQIKSEDAKVLAAAKKYTDEAPFDAAGSAATAESNAKSYADGKVQELAEGQVKLNKEAIEILNGADTVEGSVAKAVKDAKETLQASIDTVDEKADANAEAISAINNADTGLLKQAKDYADTEDAKIEKEVADLEAYVGTFTHATAKTVVEYINAKTDGIATSGNLEALGARVTSVEGDVATIKGDYLKAADKTELEGKITSEETARTEADAGLSARIKAVEDDYLKAADKTELTNAITTAKQEAIATVLGEGTDEDFDTLKEVADWILSDTTGAAALQTDVSTLKTEMDEVQADVEQAKKDIDAVEGTVATKADKTYVDEKVEALQGADTAIKGRLDALEGAIGESGSVADDISAAKQAAIDAAAADATSKANAAEAAAKGHADSLNTAMNTRVEALEAIDHDHANKAELDLIATGDKAKWDAAAAKAHEHANSAELDKIAEGDVAKWNAAESNAKAHADSLNTAMTTKVDGVGTRVGTLETTITTKADAEDLEDAVERIAKNETDIAALTTSVNNFVAITSDEVNALFA
jgi:hypothetical protein